MLKEQLIPNLIHPRRTFGNPEKEKMDLETTLEECFRSGPGPADFTAEETREMHIALLERSSEELHEAIEADDVESIRDIATWVIDEVWRPYSYLACCAVAGTDPDSLREDYRFRNLCAALHLRVDH